jgi:hypothetical protein
MSGFRYQHVLAFVLPAFVITSLTMGALRVRRAHSA